ITSGKKLAPWVATWLKTAGVNTFRPVLEISGDSYSSVSIAQEVPKIPTGSKELRPHRMAVGLYDLVGNVLKVRKSVEFDLEGPLTKVNELSGEKVADLLLINDRDLTYGKIRFDEKSISTLKSSLGKLEDQLARTLCWAAAWDMLRDAELSASDFVDIAIAGLPGEVDVTMVTTLGNQLSGAVEIYASDKNRDGLREKLAAELSRLLDSAKPGSDLQLQYARLFANLASTAEQGKRIRELMDGQLAGLVVDVDLRWQFLTALVERGLATMNDVDSELQRDNTLTGKLSYERCLAAFPTKEAKEKAFVKTTADDSISNWSRLYTLQGMVRPLHRELLAEYIDRYFALILDT
ncbi:MAG: aminopeptidase N, partial [Actinobacteria bacterium]|nr:aminopeptidase N [Actinomycetota bacterium]